MIAELVLSPRRYDLAPGAEWAEPDSSRANRAVFIGRNLDEHALRAALLECRAAPSFQNIQVVTQVFD